MNLTAFVPTNTQKARTTVIRAFKRILELQDVSMEYYHASILNDLVKTAEEQGLTLVPDKDDFLSCPLLTLSVALATHEVPCTSLLGHLPALNPEAATPLNVGVPLHDLLAAEPASLQVAVMPTPASATTVDATADATVSITLSSSSASTDTTGHVNRMILRDAESAGVAAALISHSFRRGEAQHANDDDHIAAQCNFDSGAWGMTKTDKAFVYIMNASREDRKVARISSGWDADASPKVIDIEAQDHTSR
ncbi:Hypothetical protein PHPALM_18719 [Phytophthora palmivora]|uniref:Uncharacterized protein n=1 Tax=Phytophthora palmivora TaxID=4796 RepID=A0A2P4XJ18_9STRA|nr:Hypothetical protein PHPALM_18719 [Phytophthora palmivora]